MAAMRRLFVDLRELNASPLPTIAAEPLAENIFEWHCNLKPLSGRFAGSVFHLILKFPKTYPSAPPKVFLSVPIAHPNVFKHQTQGYTVCLDMLEPGTGAPYGGWSSSYGVSSILTQLTAFLFDETSTTKRARTLATEVLQTKTATQNFVCPCGHTHSQPVPELLPMVNSLRVAACDVTNSFPRALDLTDAVMAHVCRFLCYADVCSVSSADERLARVISKFGLDQKLELRCFHSRTPFAEDLLGFGIEPEFHNRSQDIKALSAVLDPISYTSFRRGLRTGAWGHRFSYFLPLLITTEHSRKAFPVLESVFQELSSGWKAPKTRQTSNNLYAFSTPLRSSPADLLGASALMAVRVCTKLMNSMVVDFMLQSEDTSRHYHSENALKGYCAFHHLLLGCAQRWPAIVNYANATAKRFVRDKTFRHKDTVPDLGEFIALLSVCDSPWEKCIEAILEELLCRNVRWAVKAAPELKNLSPGKVSTCYRLCKTFQHSRTGLRLLMFQCFFLNTVAWQGRETKKQKNTNALVLETQAGDQSAPNQNDSQQDQASTRPRVRKVSKFVRPHTTEDDLFRQLNSWRSPRNGSSKVQPKNTSQGKNLDQPAAQPQSDTRSAQSMSSSTPLETAVATEDTPKPQSTSDSSPSDHSQAWAKGSTSPQIIASSVIAPRASTPQDQFASSALGKLLTAYNRRMGQPLPGLARRLQLAVFVVLEVEGYGQTLDFVGARHRMTEELEKLLTDAVRSSARKRYHQGGTMRVAPQQCICGHVPCLFNLHAPETAAIATSKEAPPTSITKDILHKPSKTTSSSSASSSRLPAPQVPTPQVMGFGKAVRMASIVDKVRQMEVLDRKKKAKLREETVGHAKVIVETKKQPKRPPPKATKLKTSTRTNKSMPPPATSKPTPELQKKEGEWRRSLKVGSAVDAMDYAGSWYTAKVRKIEHECLTIAFDGWEKKWDEMFDRWSPCLARLLTKAKGGRRATDGPDHAGAQLGSANVFSEQELDVVFMFDTTGSMAEALHKVRDSIRESSARMLARVAGLRLAIVAHGDYCDYANYVTKHLDFTTDPSALRSFMDEVKDTDGGDVPEAYEAALRKAKHLSWRKGAAKALIMFGDAYPHEGSFTEEKIYWQAEMKNLAKRGVKIFSVNCAPNDYSACSFFGELADRTGGVYLSINNFKHVSDMSAAICFRMAGSHMLEALEEKMEDEDVKEDGRVRAAQSDKQTSLNSIFRTLRNASLEKKSSTGRKLTSSWWCKANDTGEETTRYQLDKNTDTWSLVTSARVRHSGKARRRPGALHRDVLMLNGKHSGLYMYQGMRTENTSKHVESPFYHRIGHTDFMYKEAGNWRVGPLLGKHRQYLYSECDVPLPTAIDRTRQPWRAHNSSQNEYGWLDDANIEVVPMPDYVTLKQDNTATASRVRPEWILLMAFQLGCGAHNLTCVADLVAWPMLKTTVQASLAVACFASIRYVHTNLVMGRYKYQGCQGSHALYESKHAKLRCMDKVAVEASSGGRWFLTLKHVPKGKRWIWLYICVWGAAALVSVLKTRMWVVLFAILLFALFLFGFTGIYIPKSPLSLGYVVCVGKDEDKKDERQDTGKRKDKHKTGRHKSKNKKGRR